MLLVFLYALIISCFVAGLYNANETDGPALFLSASFYMLGFIVYFLLLWLIKNTLLMHRKYIGTQRQDYLEYYMVGILIVAVCMALVIAVSLGYLLVYETVAPPLRWCVKSAAVLTIAVVVTHIAGSIAPRKDIARTAL